MEEELPDNLISTAASHPASWLLLLRWVGETKCHGELEMVPPLLSKNGFSSLSEAATSFAHNGAISLLLFLILKVIYSLILLRTEHRILLKQDVRVQ